MTNQYAPDYAIPPGATLLETIEYMNMTQAELAERTGRPKKQLMKSLRANMPLPVKRPFS